MIYNRLFKLITVFEDALGQDGSSLSSGAEEQEEECIEEVEELQMRASRESLGMALDSLFSHSKQSSMCYTAE